MTQEEKELLLQDLCARLPYGVKLQNIHDPESIVKLRSIDFDDYCYEIMFYTYEGKALTVCDRSKLLRRGKVLRYKPYLFPLSSITIDQWNDLGEFTTNDISYVGANVDWFNKNHFDYRGLIEKGLAIDATGLNIY